MRAAATVLVVAMTAATIVAGLILAACYVLADNDLDAPCDPADWPYGDDE